MKLNVEVALDYALDGLSSILLQIEAAEMADQHLLESHIDVRTPEHFVRIPGEDAIGERIWLQASGSLACDYRASIEIDRPPVDLASLDPVEMHELPGETVKYLMGSRYSQSDQFQNFVRSEFTGVFGGARISAIRDWIEATFEYVPGSSDAETTALDTFIQRRGVCRDYAHVMVTLARAAGVPARVVSVYGLGVEPPDFHAVAEVFLGHGWRLVDATGMCGADAMARVGVGRDAADISFMTVFGGPVTLRTQSVRVTRG
jgi:transglutaminase-like putative cysteine protease